MTSWYVPMGGVRISRSSCAPCAAMLWACLKGLTTISSPRYWEVAVSRYRVLFDAFGIRPQDVFILPPNRVLCIGPHVV